MKFTGTRGSSANTEVASSTPPTANSQLHTLVDLFSIPNMSDFFTFNEITNKLRIRFPDVTSLPSDIDMVTAVKVKFRMDGTQVAAVPGATMNLSRLFNNLLDTHDVNLDTGGAVRNISVRFSGFSLTSAQVTDLEFWMQLLPSGIGKDEPGLEI